MDYFEKVWNSFLQEPDKNAWSLVLFNEALAKAAQAPFAADQKRAQSLIEKGLNSKDPWLGLLAARAALIGLAQVVDDVGSLVQHRAGVVVDQQRKQRDSGVGPGRHAAVVQTR